MKIEDTKAPLNKSYDKIIIPETIGDLQFLLDEYKNKDELENYDLVPPTIFVGKGKKELIRQIKEDYMPYDELTEELAQLKEMWLATEK